MNVWFLDLTNNLQHPSHVGAVAALLIDSFVVLAAAGICCLFCQRAAAATKHLIWFLGLASLPLLLCLTFSNPGLGRLWSVSSGFNSGNQVSLSLTFPLAKGGDVTSSAPPGATAASSANRTEQASH